MSMVKAFFNSILMGAAFLICGAAAIYLVSMLFVLVWNEGPAYIFKWPEINDWWRGGLLLLCIWLFIPRIITKTKD